jgi:hypothetical protein
MAMQNSPNDCLVVESKGYLWFKPMLREIAVKDFLTEKGSLFHADGC